MGFGLRAEKYRKPGFEGLKSADLTCLIYSSGTLDLYQFNGGS